MCCHGAGKGKTNVSRFDYYYGFQAEQFSFIRVPKLFFTESDFSELSSEAKILYGIMLDRMSLSVKNQWLDEQNRVYIILTIEEIMTLLNCKNQKAGQTLSELTAFGLVEKKRRGLGKPSLLYLKNFVQKEGRF